MNNNANAVEIRIEVLKQNGNSANSSHTKLADAIAFLNEHAGNLVGEKTVETEKTSEVATGEKTAEVAATGSESGAEKTDEEKAVDTGEEKTAETAETASGEVNTNTAAA